jgi:adenylate cyclase
MLGPSKSWSEGHALSELNAIRHEIFDLKIAEHHGRIFKTTGDGILVEFASVVDAVNSSIGIQRAMAKRNRGLSFDERIEYRIGVNIGDVIEDAGDLYGDGVNVAARLEAIAESGGIALVFAASTSGASAIKSEAGPRNPRFRISSHTATYLT